MNKCSEELRKARESLDLTLEDISIATRINIKILEAIEEGNFDILPKAYIRAFIRSYASEVGLSPDEMIKVYEQSTKSETEEIESIKKNSIDRNTKVRLPRKKGVAQSTVLIIIAVLIIAGLIFTISMIKEKENSIVEEIPFEEAYKDDEKKVKVTEDTLGIISPQFLPETQKPLEPGDSLILYISAVESAWINVLIDEKTNREILLLSNKDVQWKAAEQFRLTVGNAGAITIKLNNKTLQPIGKRGRVVRDYIIDRNTFKEND